MYKYMGTYIYIYIYILYILSIDIQLYSSVVTVEVVEEVEDEEERMLFFTSLRFKKIESRYMVIR